MNWWSGHDESNIRSGVVARVRLCTATPAQLYSPQSQRAVVEAWSEGFNGRNMSALRSLVHPLKKGEFDASKARIKHRFGSWRLKSYLFGDKVRVNDGFLGQRVQLNYHDGSQIVVREQLSFPVKGVGGWVILTRLVVMVAMSASFTYGQTFSLGPPASQSSVIDAQRSSVKTVDLRDLNFDYPVSLEPEVVRYLKLFTGESQNIMRGWLARMGLYEDVIYAELKAAHCVP